MFLIDYDSFIKQVIPPHWRGKWQHHLIAALCVPLKKAFNRIYIMRLKLLDEADDNLQVAAFESTLNQLNGFAKRRIEIGQGSENGAIKIIYPNDKIVKKVIRQHYKKVKIAGTSIEFTNE